MANVREAANGGGTGEHGSDSSSSDMSSGQANSFRGANDKTKGGANKHRDAANNIAKTETNVMIIFKILMLSSILMAAILVSAGTFQLLDSQEDDEYSENYLLFTSSIRDAVQSHAKNIFQAFEACAESITSAALATNATFPFVTVPNFEIIGADTRARSGIEMLFWQPLVDEGERDEWLRYSAAHQGWLDQSRALASLNREGLSPLEYIYSDIPDIIWDRDENLTVRATAAEPPYIPIWQVSPPPFHPGFVNFNLPTFPGNKEHLDATLVERAPIIASVMNLHRLGLVAQNPADHDAYHEQLVDWKKPEDQEFSAFNNPHSGIAQPIFSELYNESSEIVGFVMGVLPWDHYVTNLLPEGVPGITCVVENSCGQSYTYHLDGRRATFVGNGDWHETAYSDKRQIIPFEKEGRNETEDLTGSCKYRFVLYPSAAFEDEYRTNLPTTMTLIVACTFAILTITFFFYDCFVRRRNSKILQVAARSGAIVASMFPATVRDRLFAADNAKPVDQKVTAMPTRLKNFMKDGALDMDAEEEYEDILKTKPIADLFPETTILFADIAGFTAWSSVREPSQVFTLLETLYRAFDSIASQRGVFKVETIGDCYVAVAGLPEPRKNHALVMARFANDIRNRFNVLVKKLEVALGPDTGDLNLRAGLHSGPVTAGVLRGENARFQLFGDTMNVASRMESNGERNRIQVSQETADLLIAGGKSHWVSPREDKIKAKGKGELQTYWLNVSKSKRSSETESEPGSSENNPIGEEQVILTDNKMEMERMNRLIDWNTDVLLNLLRQIAFQRLYTATENSGEVDAKAENEFAPCLTVIDEVAEIIRLPQVATHASSKPAVSADSIELGEIVEKQLRSFVSVVASLYRDNHFHNFEHASHVTMSVVKLMARIVAPSDIKSDESLHDHTYGITSDPLTQFACVLSALIHDIDHQGVPNTRLIDEKPDLAAFYKNKSIAEQNSIDMAWSLLMDDNYAEFRSVIYTTEEERKRFRQIVVNSVMSTDIMDKDLKILRNKRWDKAFNGNKEDNTEESVNRKATIVIEHLIQASDIAHTMQHWHIYRKWNMRLFEEMYKAYREGRSASNPADSWYRGEIGFFDFYIIPLAKKLKDCGVFGVSSDEYLNYAQNNRKEWEERGQEIVAEMVDKVVSSYEVVVGVETPTTS